MSSYPTIEASRGSCAPGGALVVAVEPGSPADEAGFAAGCRITTVNGMPLRDVIDWRWLSDGDAIAVGYVDLDGDVGEVELLREEGEGWGLDFEGVVFDGVRQCRNACTFCFMRQLPGGMRPSLSLRDDDFRLSFLAGTFVTLTNLAPEDEARIVEQRISPLRVSLHAVDAGVRRALMGRHAAHGLAALDRLLAAGIQAHAQIVLVPGANDGAVLEGTLRWAYERPGILDVGVVPLGYTRHQSIFAESFNEPVAARAALATLAPFQRRAEAERGTPWVFAADEFYRNAYGSCLLEHVPPAAHYGDFSLFEDGIGIIRSYVDDWHAAQRAGLARRAAQALSRAGLRARYVVGHAMRETLPPLVAASPLAGRLEPLFVSNGFFGGNVDVTGLLCGVDMAEAVRRAALQERVGSEKGWGDAARRSDALEARPADSAPAECIGGASLRAGLPEGQEAFGRAASGEAPSLFLVPRVVLNDEGVTLDDMSLEDMEKAAGVPLAVVSCNPTEFLEEIAAMAAARAPRA